MAAEKADIEDYSHSFGHHGAPPIDSCHSQTGVCRRHNLLGRWTVQLQHQNIQQMDLPLPRDVWSVECVHAAGVWMIQKLAVTQAQ
jgi:hypothetical protein